MVAPHGYHGSGPEDRLAMRPLPRLRRIAAPVARVPLPCARVEVWTHRPGDRREVSVSVSAISDTFECELASAQTVERALAALDLRLADRGRRTPGAEADLRVELPAPSTEPEPAAAE